MSSNGSSASKVMAHRGGRHGGPPNSIAAVSHAAEVGALSVEIDVNTTIDGQLVATHDAIVGDGAWITEVSYDDLVADDADEWSARRLGDVIDFALSKSLMIYLDLKSTTPAGLSAIAATWNDAVESQQIVFASSRGDVISWICSTLPGATTSFLYYDYLLDLRSLTGYMTPTFVHPCYDFMSDPFRSANESYVERARALGFGLVSWSENDPERVKRLAELGFDYICTDEPALAKSVIDDTSPAATPTA